MANQGWRFLGDSPRVREILASVTRLLPTLGPGRRVPPILLQGETGTGKGLLARTIHEAGPRAAGPFVDLNCAAIPATLIEAELFGFERGAFTDARQARTGLVEAAHRGTLFLDEIGLVPEGLQAKLLTVLETREVRPLGGTRARAVDVSIIAATNSDLREAVSQRRFREDLYHRLAVLVLSLPPLRERGDDVLELAEAFLGRACADHALTKQLAEDARAAIAAYRWPGNVRELANLMERVALLTEGSIITAADLALPIVSTPLTPTDREPPDPLSLKASVDTFTRARVEQALNEARGNVSAAAERLGVPRSTLRYQMERFGLTQGGTGRASRRTAPPTPPLSERVLVRARTVEGERRQVTVLFADFTEATARVAGGDPEAARQLFDPILATMIDAIRRHDGSVIHVREDGLMALFGAPVAHEDHAARACYAALSMHERVGHLAEGMRSSVGVDVQVRIGMHSGDVALRVIGDEVRLDYAAIPETTHVAARMEQASRPGTTLITPETVRLAEGFVEVAHAAAAGIYELRAPSIVRSRLRAAIARSLSQFVGRDAEITQIGIAMDRAQSGRGQVVALVGEPGVGKSRLVFEFTRSRRAQDWLVLEATALSYGMETSYLPVIELLKAYFKITELETHREIREKVTGKLLTLDRALAPILPAVLTLLDVPIEDGQWQALDPPQRRARILEAIKQLLLRESRNQPVLVVFEDLHWVDAETQAFLDRLVEVLPTARLLLIVSYRPEYEQRWAHKTYYTSLRVDPLDGESVAKLLQAVLGSDPSLHEFRSILIERTEGNPFFIEEIVRALAETHVIVGERGRYRLGKTMAAIQVPSTVQAVLAARIDRLSLEDKRLLQSASVIGKDVPLVLLQAIADTSPDELHTSLRRLQAAEFLYETSLVPDVEFTFKHALTHDVAYRSLLDEPRRLLHARIVDAIEGLFGGRLSEQVERLAHHALRGELREKAVQYLRQAGLKADARSALEDARSWFEQALGVLDALPPSRSRLEQAFDIRLELRPVLNLLGKLPQVLERLREAESLANRLRDDCRRGRVLAFMTNVHSFLGELDEAVASGNHALAIARELGDMRLRILTTTLLEMTHGYRGEYDRAIVLATDNLAALPPDWTYEYFGNAAPASVYDRTFLVMNLAEIGRFVEAAEYEAEALRLAEPTHHAFTLGLAHMSGAVLYLVKGDWEKARFLSERASAIMRAGNVVVLLSRAVALSAWALAQLGEASEALNRLGEGKHLLERQVARIPGLLGRVYQALAHASLLLGQLDEARSLGNRVVESFAAQPGFVAHALHLLGNIASHPDRFDAEGAEGNYRKALALAEPRGMRPLVAHCHLGLGKLYQRTGKREQAQEHLTTATTMYREMGMTYWVEKTEAEMKKIAR